MNQELNYSNANQTEINKNNLLTKIWTTPTDTFIYIFKNCPQKYLMILFALGGIAKGLERLSSRTAENELIPFIQIVISAFFGALLGWVSYYFYAWILNITGEWLNGKAQPKQFRTVIAWSLIPSICTIIILIPELIVFKSNLFENQQLLNESLNGFLIIFFLIVKITLTIWTFVILVKGTSLIQGFSNTKSILNIFLPILIIVLPILLFLFLFNLIS